MLTEGVEPGFSILNRIETRLRFRAAVSAFGFNTNIFFDLSGDRNYAGTFEAK